MNVSKFHRTGVYILSMCTLLPFLTFCSDQTEYKQTKRVEAAPARSTAQAQTAVQTW